MRLLFEQILDTDLFPCFVCVLFDFCAKWFVWINFRIHSSVAQIQGMSNLAFRVAVPTSTIQVFVWSQKPGIRVVVTLEMGYKSATSIKERNNLDI
jgi:hypothetical protein